MYKLDSQKLAEKSYKNIQDLGNKNILMRASLDVVVDENGKMTETARFYEALPLIKELAGKVKTLIITAHLGRPAPLNNNELKNQKNSFWNVVEVLNIELKADNSELTVELINSLDPATIEKIKNNSDKNKVFLIENIRFFEGEESKDQTKRIEFAQLLASMADAYINDAFPAYREAASTYDIAKILPSYVGPLFSKEIISLAALSSPKQPFVAVLGGAKLSEKLDALKSLAEIADKVLIGGAMAYTLMKAKGISIGKSKFEEDKLEVASEINEKYGDKIFLPTDHLLTTEFSETADYKYSEGQEIPEGLIAIDIGWDTIKRYKAEVESAGTILWNGPMGVFEWTHSAIGTQEIGISMGENTDAFRLAGGGDSIAAINALGLKGFDHISTGGGAMLAFLAYDKFPILDVILNN